MPYQLGIGEHTDKAFEMINDWPSGKVHLFMFSLYLSITICDITHIIETNAAQTNIDSTPMAIRDMVFVSDHVIKILDTV